MDKSILLFSFIVFLVSCQGKNTLQVNIDIDSTTIEVVKFRYEPQKQKAILFDGRINDSITVNVLFDTGLKGDIIMVSDSLLLEGHSEEMINSIDRSTINNLNDSIYLQIGSIKDHKKVKYIQSSSFFFEYFGSKSICVGWEFFKDQIIEISYKEKSIKILKDNYSLDSFEKIKIEQQGNLVIPITVFVQGKYLTERVLIDTGNNGSVNFGNSVLVRYSLDTKNAERMIAQAITGDQLTYFLKADTVKVGNCFTVGNNIAFSSHHSSNKKMPIGLLGNSFLENYTVILDLKEFNMYLKPIK